MVLWEYACQVAITGPKLVCEYGLRIRHWGKMPGKRSKSSKMSFTDRDSPIQRIALVLLLECGMRK